MRDIAAEAQMSLGNIYRYFKNKEALIEVFIDLDMRAVDDIFSSLEEVKDFYEGLRQIAIGYIQSLSKKSDLLIYMDILTKAMREQNTETLLALEGDTKALERQLKTASDDGRIKLSLPASASALALMAFIENAAIKCITHEGYRVEQAIKEFEGLLSLILDQ